MRIFLNNTEVDTFPDASPVAVTYGLAPLGDVSTRRANVTTSFRLPLSDHNREIIGLSDTVQGNDSTPYTVLDCVIEQGGARVLDGKAVIERILPDAVELSAYSGLFSFFEAIKDERLQDLDLTDLDHTWNLADVAARVAPAALANGFTWAVSDLGGITGGTIFNIEYQRPQITLPELCERIATAQGYNLAGDFWTSQPFTITGILLMESDEQRRRDFREARNFVYRRDESTGFSATLIDNAGPYNPTWQVSFSIAEDPGEIWNGNAYLEHSSSTVNFKVDLTWSDYTDNDILTEYSRSNYTTELIHIDSVGGETVLDSNVSAATFDHTVSLSADAVSVTSGERVIVRISFDVTQPGPPAGYNLNLSFNLTDATIKTSKATGAFVLNSPITAATMLPDMTQKDFLLMVAKLYGLILVADDKAGTLTAYRFEEILNATNTAIDWSDKLVPARATVYTEKRTRAEKYGQRSYLRFKNDELSPDFDYGRTWLTVPDATLPREKVLAEVDLAASDDNETVSLPIPILYAPLYEFDGVSAYDETEKDFIDRLTLIIADYPGNPSITLQEGAGGATSVIAPGDYLACIPVAEDTGAHFDRYLSRDGYAALQTVLNNYQEIDCLFNLDTTDIVGLDLTRLIYLRQFGSYFYVEKVHNYVFGKVTKVTLIKVKP